MAHEAQDHGGAENHVRREIRLLALLAVDLERHAGPGQGERVAAHERRPDGREVVECLGVEELPAAVLRHLEEAAGQVIADRVAEDGVRGFGFRDVSACSRRHEDEFGLDFIFIQLVSARFEA